jgi:hypothetical protein
MRTEHAYVLMSCMYTIQPCTCIPALSNHASVPDQAHDRGPLVRSHNKGLTVTMQHTIWMHLHDSMVQLLVPQEAHSTTNPSHASPLTRPKTGSSIQQ